MPRAASQPPKSITPPGLVAAAARQIAPGSAGPDAAAAQVVPERVQVSPCRLTSTMFPELPPSTTRLPALSSKAIAWNARAEGLPEPRLVHVPAPLPSHSQVSPRIVVVQYRSVQPPWTTTRCALWS